MSDQIFRSHIGNRYPSGPASPQAQRAGEQMARSMKRREHTAEAFDLLERIAAAGLEIGGADCMREASEALSAAKQFAALIRTVGSRNPRRQERRR